MMKEKKKGMRKMDWADYKAIELYDRVRNAEDDHAVTDAIAEALRRARSPGLPPGEYRVRCSEDPEHTFAQTIKKGDGGSRVCGICGSALRIATYLTIHEMVVLRNYAAEACRRAYGTRPDRSTVVHACEHVLLPAML